VKIGGWAATKLYLDIGDIFVAILLIFRFNVQKGDSCTEDLRTGDSAIAIQVSRVITFPIRP
jgi:hypothetical protein